MKQEYTNTIADSHLDRIYEPCPECGGSGLSEDSTEDFPQPCMECFATATDDEKYEPSGDAHE